MPHQSPTTTEAVAPRLRDAFCAPPDRRGSGIEKKGVEIHFKPTPKRVNDTARQCRLLWCDSPKIKANRLLREPREQEFQQEPRERGLLQVPQWRELLQELREREC